MDNELKLSEEEVKEIEKRALEVYPVSIKNSGIDYPRGTKYDEHQLEREIWIAGATEERLKAKEREASHYGRIVKDAVDYYDRVDDIYDLKSRIKSLESQLAEKDKEIERLRDDKAELKAELCNWKTGLHRIEK